MVSIYEESFNSAMNFAFTRRMHITILTKILTNDQVFNLLMLKRMFDTSGYNFGIKNDFTIYLQESCW